MPIRDRRLSLSAEEMPEPKAANEMIEAINQTCQKFAATTTCDSPEASTSFRGDDSTEQARQSWRREREMKPDWEARIVAMVALWLSVLSIVSSAILLLRQMIG